jgi:hypothetical protein
MNSPRLTIRMPREGYDKLSAVSESAGYSSPCQLARCILMQFLKHREEHSRVEVDHTDWIDDMIEDYRDPRCRKAINERL